MQFPVKIKTLPSIPSHLQLGRAILLAAIAKSERKGVSSTSNISRILVRKKIVDYSNVVGAPLLGAAPITSSFSTLTPGLGKENCQTRRETYKYLDLAPYTRGMTVIFIQQ